MNPLVVIKGRSTAKLQLVLAHVMIVAKSVGTVAAVGSTLIRLAIRYTTVGFWWDDVSRFCLSDER